ncbi:MAG: FKBP-type peptidyl-prolyl cis-trans isomerase [bacterium]
MYRVLIVLLLGIFVAACQERKEEKTTLNTRAQKYSYGVGVELGNQLRFLQIQFSDLDPELVARGVKDVLEQKELLASERELKKAKLLTENEMMEKEAKTRMKRDPEFEALAKKNKEASDAFLEKNKNSEGMQVTGSGLQYEIIKPGSGSSPGFKDEVRINFRGTLIDGTEFDSSEKSYGGPAKFRVQHLIPGFAEALQMMKEGGKWKIFIPSDLAYGMGGREPLIGPNAALVFEVELLEVIPNQYEYKGK